MRQFLIGLTQFLAHIASNIGSVISSGERISSGFGEAAANAIISKHFDAVELEHRGSPPEKPRAHC